jgi:hypothetical protein
VKGSGALRSEFELLGDLPKKRCGSLIFNGCFHCQDRIITGRLTKFPKNLIQIRDLDPDPDPR